MDCRLIDISRYGLGCCFYDSLKVGGQLVSELFSYVKFIFTRGHPASRYSKI